MPPPLQACSLKSFSITTRLQLPDTLHKHLPGMSELETPWLLVPGSWLPASGSSLLAPGPREEMEMKYSLTENLEQTMFPQ